MSDLPQQTPLSVRAKTFVTTLIYLLGVVLVIAGFVAGPLRDWNLGSWCLIAGFVLVTVSSAGRPVFINVFQEHNPREQGTGFDNSGYL